MGIKIDRLKCTGCEVCVLACPVDVLYVEDMKCHVKEGCISCGACVDTCTFNAITMEDESTGKKD